MPPSFGRRCWCGALLVVVTASGLVFHQPHTPHESFSAPAPRAVSVLASSAYTGPVFTGTGALTVPLPPIDGTGVATTPSGVT